MLLSFFPTFKKTLTSKNIPFTSMLNYKMNINNSIISVFPTHIATLNSSTQKSLNYKDFDAVFVDCSSLIKSSELENIYTVISSSNFAEKKNFFLFLIQ